MTTTIVLAMCVMLLAATARIEAQSPMTEKELLASADARIEKYRKADAVVRVVGADGKPLAGVAVHIEQTRHAFLFGCNAFPLLHHADPKQEETYQREFAALLNYATLGFYWKAYEPQPGVTRETLLEAQARWLKEHGIETKGHPLVWHEVYPDWAPSDADEARTKLLQRIHDIVRHFAGLIDRWDVVNEATSAPGFDNGEAAWIKRDGAAVVVGEALSAARVANRKAFLLYNDFKTDVTYEDLAQRLLKDRKPVNCFGIQSHMHGGEWPLTKAWQVCETFARFRKPLHFTELTVISGEHGWRKPLPWPTTPEGETRQADYVEKLYTLLFSHPAVEAITWWDFMDGAWMGAPAGLVRADLTPKPAYDRLLALLKDRWWTRLDAVTDNDGVARFRGFTGSYGITVTTATQTATRTMELRKRRGGAITVRMR
jgi:endo-1,4-beta-xylanase